MEDLFYDTRRDLGPRLAADGTFLLWIAPASQSRIHDAASLTNCDIWMVLNTLS